MRFRLALLGSAFAVLSGAANADMSEFSTGPVIDDHGPGADVQVTYPIPDGATFKHSFDVAQRAEEGKANRTFESAARFINMHARAGVAPERIRLAVVVHGSAVHDVSDRDAGSAELIKTLVGHGVEIVVCGQSAAYYGVATEDLLPGVRMAVSAMTAHALLQQRGFTLNPF